VCPLGSQNLNVSDTAQPGAFVVPLCVFQSSTATDAGVTTEAPTPDAKTVDGTTDSSGGVGSDAVAQDSAGATTETGSDGVIADEVPRDGGSDVSAPTPSGLDASTVDKAGGSGCSCDLGGGHGHASGGLIAFLLVSALLFIRRRRSG
jgi:MYXO-CTERM domain-containing protein